MAELVLFLSQIFTEVCLIGEECINLSLEVTQGAIMNLFRDLYFILKISKIYAGILSYSNYLCPLFMCVGFFFFFLQKMCLFEESSFGI